MSHLFGPGTVGLLTGVGGTLYANSFSKARVMEEQTNIQLANQRIPTRSLRSCSLNNCAILVGRLKGFQNKLKKISSPGVFLKTLLEKGVKKTNKKEAGNACCLDIIRAEGVKDNYQVILEYKIHEKTRFWGEFFDNRSTLDVLNTVGALCVRLLTVLRVPVVVMGDVLKDKLPGDVIDYAILNMTTTMEEEGIRRQQVTENFVHPQAIEVGGTMRQQRGKKKKKKQDKRKQETKRKKRRLNKKL